jgi:hypothetical protein
MVAIDVKYPHRLNTCCFCLAILRWCNLGDREPQMTVSEHEHRDGDGQTFCFASHGGGGARVRIGRRGAHHQLLDTVADWWQCA